jgi:demethylmenaquinone methyltransferase/2-methoxy-6-polyprenyl-1,4-benzoquinol methylase
MTPTEPPRSWSTVYGESSSLVRRQLSDGTPYRVVKVPHETKALERRLQQLGWRIAITPASGPFFWGAGRLGLNDH